MEQWAALATEAIAVAERPACTIDNAECSGDVWARLAAEAADSALSPWAQLVEEDAGGVLDGDDIDCAGGEAQIPRPPMTRKGGSTDSSGGMVEAFSIIGFSQRCKRGRPPKRRRLLDLRIVACGLQDGEDSLGDRDGASELSLGDTRLVAACVD